MTTSKLAIYNGALLELGDRKLATLSDDQDSRYTLDSIWDGEDGVGGVLRYCLSKGQWMFAKRSRMMTYSPSIEPEFGPRYAFEHPDDFVRVSEVYQDASFKHPLREYRSEAGFWFADLDTIYVAYISDDEDYGADLSLWAPTFAAWVPIYMAYRAAPRLNRERESALFEKQKGALREALSIDAMEQPTRTPPAGNWVRARGRVSSNHRMGTDGLTG